MARTLPAAGFGGGAVGAAGIALEVDEEADTELWNGEPFGSCVPAAGAAGVLAAATIGPGGAGVEAVADALG